MHDTRRALGRSAFLGLGALLAVGFAWTAADPAAAIQPAAAAIDQEPEVEIIEEEPVHAAADSPWDVRPLLVGAEIPDLVLASAAGEEVSLHAACAERPRIFVFYRGGW